jgi:zinc protease
MLAPAPQATSPTPRATEFRLSNDMHVVVVPHRRAPVVTHMVWYKAGAADGRIGASGIAHFLEHLMFKSTGELAAGELSKIVVALGGQENAFTNPDVTVYHQRVPKKALATVMAMEADRMVNLRIVEDEVASERQVIIQERASRFANLEAMMVERMTAALYVQHPYGTPVIGWGHEIPTLSREDVFDFYRRYYAPNNAVLVVAGDVDVDAVRELAEQIYGRIALDRSSCRLASASPRSCAPGPTAQQHHS